MRFRRFLVFALTLLSVGFFSASAAQAANRYWVGGSADWDGTAASKWALTTGGAGGQAVPTSSDACFFDAASGASAVNIAAGNTGCGSLDFTGFTGSLTGSTDITISGNVTFGAGMTRTYTGSITLNANANLTSNGTSGSERLNINGSGITVTLKDDYSTTGLLDLALGTIDAADSGANHNVTLGSFYTFYTNVRALTMGNGLWTITGSNGTVFNIRDGTNFTLNRGTQPFKFTYSGNTGSRGIVGPTGATANYNNSPDIWVSAGTDIIQMWGNGTAFYRNVDFTGFTGLLSSASGGRGIYGNATWGVSMTINAQTNQMAFVPRLGDTSIVTTNGVVCDCLFTVLGPGMVRLADDLNMTNVGSYFVFGGGTFDANGHNVTVYFAETDSFTLAKSTGTFKMGSGTWTVNGWLFNWGIDEHSVDLNNFTLDPGTSTIVMNGSLDYFYGNGLAYHNLEVSGAASSLTFDYGSGSYNTFDNITVDNSVARTLKFGNLTGSTGIAASTFNVQGTATNPITLMSSTSGQPWTLIKNSGGVSSNDYLILSDSHASPGSTWYAGTHSTDSGGNTGWLFTNPPAGASRHPEDEATPTPVPVPAPSPTPYITPSPTPTPETTPTPMPVPAPTPTLITTPPPNMPAPAAAGALGPLKRAVVLGAIGIDVKRIQQLLNAQGYIINPFPGGAGSPGHETSKYGNATKFAVQRFQQAHVAELIWPYHLTAPSGVVDQQTAELLGY